MKDKWMIPVVLFVLLLVCNIFRGVFQTRIELELLQTDTIEEVRSGIGVLAKEEYTNTLPVGTTTELHINSGDRVSNDEVIATVYSGVADDRIKIQLADVNRRISAMEASHLGNAVFINDATKIESEIANTVDEVIQHVAVYDMEDLSGYKYLIGNMSDQKAVAKREKSSFSNDLVTLRSEKSVLEAQLGKIHSVETAPFPGVFLEGHDGFEKDINKAAATAFTPDQVESIIKHEKRDDVKTVKQGEYAYKIVNNYSYCVAINIEKGFLDGVKVGGTVKVRFSDLSPQVCSANVISISEPDDKNRCTVVVECYSYIEGLLAKRVVNVDFIKKSISGYKVKTEHLHTANDTIGIYIKRGAVMRFVPVDVVYSTEEEAIISAATNELPIKSYDELVTDAPVFEDGKVIVS